MRPRTEGSRQSLRLRHPLHHGIRDARTAPAFEREHVPEHWIDLIRESFLEKSTGAVQEVF
jgi:hypothetical protein